MWKNSNLHFAIVLLIIIAIGLLTVNDFGISWDEPMEVEMVHWTWEFITQGKPYPHRLIIYYGIVFNGFAELVFQLQHFIHSLFTSLPTLTLPQLIAAKISTKHTVTFLWSLMTYGAVAGIVSVFYSRTYAWLPALMLALFPRFWAHSFFNPKDIPFATIFTLTTWAGIGFVDALLNIQVLKPRYLLRKTLLFGVMAGLLCCIRLGGIVVLGFVAIAYLAIKLTQRIQIKDILRSLIYYSLASVICFSLIFALYPAAWGRPLAWLSEGLTALSNYPHRVMNLFAGQNIDNTIMPWNYIPQWFAVTTPLIFLVLLVLGVLIVTMQYKTFSQRQQVAAILVGLQVFFLPLVAIVRRSSLYDEIRHFLFIVPGVAVFCAIALIWAYKKLDHRPLKIGLVSAVTVIFLQIILEMASLHPYQHVYFNRVSGGLAAAHDRYETEYWGLALRQAAQWLNQQAPQGQRILLLGPTEVYDLVKRPDQRFINYPAQPSDPNNNIADRQPVQQLSRYIVPGEKDQRFYVIAMTRFKWHEAFPQCPIVYEVERQDVPLTRIRRCSP